MVGRNLVKKRNIDEEKMSKAENFKKMMSIVDISFNCV